MGLFYRVSDKELVKLRNEIFVKRGIPMLEENNFKKTPFPNHWFGKDDMGGYDYSLCRLSHDNKILEIISVHIIKGDRWIQVGLNIFELDKQPKSFDDFKELDGIKFDLPPNSITNMYLYVDDIQGIPLFSYYNRRKNNRFTVLKIY